MEGLSDNVQEVTERFSKLESAREDALARSRVIIRLTKNMIHAIHIGEPYSEIQDRLDSEVKELQDKLSGEPEILSSGAVEDAMMEYSEARLFAAVIEKERLPSCTDLNISAQSWVMGLADCVGELRRKILTYLSDGDLENARFYYSCMEEIGYHVLNFDVPDAIVPIRRKQDVTRGLLEKTLSEITNAVLMSEFKKKL